MTDTLPMTGLPVTQTSDQGEVPAMPPINMAPRRKTPSGIATNVKQDIIGICDVSSSMSGDKIAELNLACADLFAVLADPVNKNGFRVRLIHFNDQAHVALPATLATKAVLPDAVASGFTDFDLPIELAVRELEASKQAPNPEGWSYMRPQVLFLSDGQASVQDHNIRQLQELADVMAIAYGDDANEDTLAKIASDGKVHRIGTDGASLRAFFANVGHTLSEGRAQAQGQATV